MRKERYHVPGRVCGGVEARKKRRLWLDGARHGTSESRTYMKPALRIALLGVMLVVAAPLFAQLHVGIGINIGPPPPRREIIVAKPYPDAV